MRAATPDGRNCRLTRYYAGVGSCDTPIEICQMMTEIARNLRAKGFHLRSGGAPRADDAFAEGAGAGARSIYVPWLGFNGLPNTDVILAPALPKWSDALIIAEEAHPAWEKCSQGARKLLARNVFQILGDDLFDPVEFVIGWTRNAKGRGGTGQTYRIANLLPEPPPIYDLADPRVYAKFREGWLPCE